MRSGWGRSSILPALVFSAISAACVSIPFDAPPGRQSGEGSLAIEPAVVAASTDTNFKITFTVGPSGIVLGGGFRIELPVDPVHPFLGFTPPHTGSRHLRGHVQCSALRDGEVAGDAAAWADGREAGCLLKTGALHPGDLLVMDYWALSPRVAGTIPLHVESRFSGGGGGRSPAWPPVLTVSPRPARVLTAVLPGAVVAGGPMTLSVVALDEFGNRAVDYRGTVDIRLGAARFTHEFTQEERGVAVLSGLAVEHPGFARAEVTELGIPAAEIPEALRLTAVSNPVHVTAEPALSVLWGDLHFHTGTGAGGRSFMRRPEGAGDHRGNYTRAEDAYAYARDVSRLDFAAATEHATALMSDEAWETTLRAAASSCESGRFTTFAAFQWNDQVVLLPAERGRLVRSDDRLTDEPGELLAALASGGPADPVIMKLASTGPPPGAPPVSPEDAPAVEIYSWRNRGSTYEDRPGVFEPGLSWALLEPLRPVTLTAGSDNHWGMPGGDDLTGLEPGVGGLTAVEAPRNDRASILEALRHGRAWATTGARIHLRVAPRGGRLEVAAAGTAVFSRIDLVVLERAGMRVIPVMASPTLDFEGAVELPRAKGRVFCYVRAVQQDGEMAWSSLIPAGGEEP